MSCFNIKSLKYTTHLCHKLEIKQITTIQKDVVFPTSTLDYLYVKSNGSSLCCIRHKCTVYCIKIIILYCMAMRGIPEYIAQARTILHASVGQVQYGPSAGKYILVSPEYKAMQYNYYYP